MNAPVIIDERFIHFCPQILVGVSKCNGTGIRPAQQEAAEIVLRGGAGEGKRAASLLLRQNVELQPALRDAGGNIVRGTVQENIGRKIMSLIAVQ